MPFESKDIRAVYDSLTIDPLFRNMHKPFKITDEVDYTGFKIPLGPKSGGFYNHEIEAYKQYRRNRLDAMYANMKNDSKYNTALKYQKI